MTSDDDDGRGGDEMDHMLMTALVHDRRVTLLESGDQARRARRGRRGRPTRRARRATAG